MPQMSFTSRNIAAEWSRFKLAIQFYLDGIAASSAMSNKRKIGIVMTALGNNELDVFNTFEVDLPQLSYEQLLALFDEYCSPRKNTVYERFIFSIFDAKPR